MRILLLYLPDYLNMSVVHHTMDRLNIPMVPSGIPTIASLLRRQGFSVEQDDLNIKLFDRNIRQKSEKSIPLDILMDEKRIHSFIASGEDSGLEEIGEQILGLTDIRNTEVMAFSAQDAANPLTIALTTVLSHVIKKQEGATVIMGGKVPEEVINQLLLSRSVDYFFRGSQLHPNASSIVEFCQHLEQGRDPRYTKSIQFFRDGRIVKNKSSRESEQFISPDYDGLPLDMYRRGSHHTLNGTEFTDDILVLPLAFVAGCPFSCAFCSNSTLSGWEAAPPIQVADTLQELSKKHKTKYFYFLNSSINPTKDYAHQFAKEIIRRDLGILWTDCMNFANSDTKLIRHLSDAGAARLIFGMESASPRLLKYINKPVKVRHAKNILRATTDTSIWTEIEVIVGIPTEEEKDVNLTIEFLKQNSSHLQQADVFKFWLEGKFRENPTSFGITLRNSTTPNSQVSSRGRCYDVIDGRTWEESVEWADTAYDKIQSACGHLMRYDTSLSSFPYPSEDHMKFIWHITNHTVSNS